MIIFNYNSDEKRFARSSKKRRGWKIYCNWQAIESNELNMLCHAVDQNAADFFLIAHQPNVSTAFISLPLVSLQLYLSQWKEI